MAAGKIVYKRLLPFVVVTALFSCGSPTGPETRPKVTITGAEDLAKIGKDPGFPLNGEYTLAADITVSGWTPIGSSAPFTGIFNGMDKAITITGTGGLFGRTKGARIRNVRVGGSISRPSGGDEFAGGIAGYIENTRIIECVSSADITLAGSRHNASAGGIAGSMRASVITDCTASGTVTLQSPAAEELMIYAGGIAGYSTGTGCEISRCVSSVDVGVQGGYPYSGGAAGYNYGGSKITECAASGAVSAKGGFLPYAGGVAGYNSASSSVENCYYNGPGVSAESASKGALAGGIAGANANGGRIAFCYAAAPVTVQIAGGDFQGIGVPPAGNAGGIAGAQYVNTPSIRNCAALNTSLTGTGGASNICRIAFTGTGSGPLFDNYAYSGMTLTGRTAEPGADKKDGADCGAKPDQAFCQSTLGWNFTTVWKMGSSYPVLKWQ